MYANATEALEGLRHKRTREILPTKVVARNTKLVYYADELVGLKLHQTVIALYRADGITFDTRGPGSPHGQGWFTNVTIDRLQQFTPAHFARRGGLLYVCANPPWLGGSEPERLYAHGCSLSCDGSFENGLEPLVERHIASTTSNWPRKSKNFANRMVTYWRRGGVMLDCCQEDDSDAHLVAHIEANEPCIPWFFAQYIDTAKQQFLVGDAMADELAKSTYQRLRELADVAITNAAPNFPYPQNPKRRR